MAEAHIIWNETFEVQSAATATQYHIVAQRAANVVNIASEDVHSSMIGVQQTKATNPGDFVTVGFLGISKVYAGAAITQAVFLTCNGSGRAVAAGSGDMVFGRALTAAGADGDLISAAIVPPYRWSGAT